MTKDLSNIAEMLAKVRHFVSGEAIPRQQEMAPDLTFQGV